nr:MFS transporter [Aurantimonas sp. VKM B-3413]
MFMENMDSTVIATSLPAIARDIGTSPIALKLALTSYYVSLAIFIPISGRIADRWGAKFVFRLAIAVFIAGSLACSIASSLEGFVAARFLQGMGGAMMTPVGRLLLVRSAPKAELVNAMAWFSIPALIGPLVGPPVGGFITTYADWRWIFLINLPIGIVGILLATRFLPSVAKVEGIRFDIPGFLLSGFACAGLVFGFSVVSLPALPPIIGVIMAISGFAASLVFIRHARRTEEPVLRLSMLSIPTLRAALIGGIFFRVGSGAVPFLLPLMLQLGFGYTPFQSGLITCVSIGGAIAMKFLAKPLLHRFGFRATMVGAAIFGGILTMAIGFARPDTPVPLVLAMLLVGGFFRSMFFTSINALAFADVPNKRAGDATAMLAAVQQVSVAMGVALAGAVLEVAMTLGGRADVGVADFSVAFFVVGAVMTTATFVFLRLQADAGDEVAGRRVPAE